MQEEVKKSKFQVNYENGVYPECFRPCPPFYDICNRGAALIVKDDEVNSAEVKKCGECYNKFGFVDFVE